MRCFIAIDVPKNLQKSLVEIQERMRESGVKLVEPENFHITLKFLGEVEEPLLTEIKNWLSKLNFPKFRVELRGIGFFPNESFVRVVFIRCLSKELERLGKLVNDELERYGFRKEEFVGHLTLARVKRRLSRNVLNELSKIRNIYIGEFVAEEVKLKRSELRPTGPIYGDLFTVKLGEG